jgi:hypothetical protein
MQSGLEKENEILKNPDDFYSVSLLIRRLLDNDFVLRLPLTNSVERYMKPYTGKDHLNNSSVIINPQIFTA